MAADLQSFQPPPSARASAQQLLYAFNKSDTKIAEDDVLEAVRLCAQPRTPQTTSRPRCLCLLDSDLSLVRTKSKVTKTEVRPKVTQRHRHTFQR